MIALFVGGPAHGEHVEVGDRLAPFVMVIPDGPSPEVGFLPASAPMTDVRSRYREVVYYPHFMPGSGGGPRAGRVFYSVVTDRHKAARALTDYLTERWILGE